MPKARDKDLQLKLRFKRILHLMGYYSPIEVELSQYDPVSDGTRRRRSLTDLDVLGLKYDEVLTPHRVVADCKSGSNVSDPNRLFWLRGVTDYFGADMGYFVKPRIGLHARAISPKLGLRAVDEDELLILEKDLNAEALPLPISDVDFHEGKSALWGLEVPKGQKPTSDQLIRRKVYSYLSYDYWYIEQHRNLLTLIEHFRNIADKLDASDARDTLLAFTGLERFAHCLLEMGSQIYSRGISDVQKHARVYLYGGPLGLREREQFFKLLGEITLTPDQLDPDYWPDLMEHLNRLLRNPTGAKELLPYLETIYGWCVQLSNQDMSSAVNGKLNTNAIVLARDLAQTFCRTTGLNENLYQSILAL